MSHVHLIRRLEGKRLEGGWSVQSKVVAAEGMTGSNFSIGYSVVREDGSKGFMKVLDISRAQLSPDPARTLEDLTSAFNFERDLCNQCRTAKMSKVVSALSEGVVRETLPSGQEETAQYIIFERAESDLRKRVQLLRDFDLAMEMRVLHNVAIGLSQLHKNRIAHQDLKPSNVLVFENRISKVGDLGRSSKLGVPGPYDHLESAGDPGYSPPEHLYGHLSNNWMERRRACDLFQLGSLVVFVFTNLSATRLLMDHVHKDHLPSIWTSDYPSLLPYLHEYFRLVTERISSHFPAEFRHDLTLAVQQLCNPDASKRGHPRNHAVREPFGLERYVSLFDRLSVRAEFKLRRSIG